ncbi:thrombospondin type 3 repeat-containing protein [Thermodesulfobacteriota bacterium]
MKDLTGNGQLYINKPTVVITHGWNPFGTAPLDQTPDWIQEMADTMINEGVDANIVWWDWIEQATSTTSASWGKAASNAPRQGVALSEALYNILGSNYNQTIHFIGHSMGARVNRQAINDLHSVWDPNKTHVTILDAAEFGDLDYHSWDKSIPNQAAWIDNYITTFGDLHPEAANVTLRQGMPVTFEPGLLGLIESLGDFHHYSYKWYIETIKNPLDSDMGFLWSFEGGGLNGSPGPGSTYVQTLNPFDSELALDYISWSEAETVMWGRNVLLIGEGALLTLSMMNGPIEAVGNVVGELVEKVNGNITEWTLRLIFEETSPAYAWVSVSIPSNAEFMSFEFLKENIGDGDYFSVGIGDELLFMLEIEYVEGQGLSNSGLLNIAKYAGQEVELFFGLNSVGAPNAKVTLEGITFHADNCPLVDNPDQSDIDGDGFGDVCDNCFDTANADQADLDEDGLGDICDDDLDGDEILNDIDNCPYISNFEQINTDNDSFGDACDNCPDDPDNDIDGDGVCGDVDNCPESDITETIIINDCDSGVENQLFDHGCTMRDLIAKCANDAKNHGKFVSCVSHLTNDWKKEGLISGKEKSVIQNCAAKSNIP